MGHYRSPHDTQHIRQQIIEAFAGVVLEDGVGLYQAQALDDYLDNRQISNAREKDEKHDWRQISVQDLNICNSSLSFFDAKGMRFHLPAFMLADLDGQYHFDLIFTLCLSDLITEQSSLLTPKQRSSVVNYLQFIWNEDESSIYIPSIVAALTDGLWSKTI